MIVTKANIKEIDFLNGLIKAYQERDLDNKNEQALLRKKQAEHSF